jgi:hypothetical protein
MKAKERFVLRALLLSVCAAVLVTVVYADWQKTNSPPDVDKAEHLHGAKPTCWIAAASNMLAGAGYGDGNNIQERADDIYLELFNGLVDGNDEDWADTALDAWLNSNYNTWSNNPYKVIDFQGHRDPRYPWANPDLPKLIGNELRKCNFVRISLRKPTCGASIGIGGHAITAWGDSGDSNDLTSNPDKVFVSDSDYWLTTENLQKYTYDDYNSPNPDADKCDDDNPPTEGSGWYINYNYNDNHRYIDNIITLSTADGNDKQTQRVITSYKIHQGQAGNATDLHSKIAVGDDILSYSVSLDWDTNNVPDINESDRQLEVDWDLSDNPVANCNWVTITSDLITPYDPNGTAVCMAGTNFTYPGLGVGKPEFNWRLRTDELLGGSGHWESHICGGYVICSFTVWEDMGGWLEKRGEVRMQRQYKYYQKPNEHEFILEPVPPINPDIHVAQFNFGHSYGRLSKEELWSFSAWRYSDAPDRPFVAPVIIPVTWPPEPYPAGQDLTNPDPKECGDKGTWYVGGDINKDCKVDFADFAELAGTWLFCTDPQNPACW